MPVWKYPFFQVGLVLTILGWVFGSPFFCTSGGIMLGVAISEAAKSAKGTTRRIRKVIDASYIDHK